MKTAMMILLLAATAACAQDAPQTTCTNASLKGDFGFTLTGTRPSAPTPGAAIETVIGTAMTHFDGNGNLTQVDNIHGSVTGFTAPDRAGSGNYSINPDCTGTMTLSSSGSPTLTLQIVVVDDGNEVRTAVVAPAPVMVTSSGRRVVTRPALGGIFRLYNGATFGVER
jgi:hypothetical protein